jgi:hypothetical protein
MALAVDLGGRLLMTPVASQFAVLNSVRGGSLSFVGALLAVDSLPEANSLILYGLVEVICDVATLSDRAWSL